MKLKITLLISFLFFSFLSNGQTDGERKTIARSSNLVELQALVEQLKVQEETNKLEVAEYARKTGAPMFITAKDGSFKQLMKIYNGSPIYYEIHNVDAAISTRANKLHNNGGLGLNIEGQNMIAHVWDGGPVRATHTEFSTGTQRSIYGDDARTLNENSFHATHVSGTISAMGTNPRAKGMAPKSTVITHDWNNDSSEMAIQAINGALLSNHSYGVRAANLNDELFGKYVADSRITDQIAFNAPYYLPVYSAGNDGNDSTSNAMPLQGSPNRDKLSLNSVTKNTMVVANAQDATIDQNGNLISVLINSGSSQGPTDDLRIKPDIAGNGTGLFSPFDSADTAYGTISGTSMSAPNITGSMLLLQQYYNQQNNSFMRAATLKGLTLHTADDVNTPGPDTIFGWGLMNTMAASNAIKTNFLNSRIVELELNQGQTYSLIVTSDAVSPLKASISWTDLPGQTNTNPANDPTAALVNDLDIRITQNNTIEFPWRLLDVDFSGKGDNKVDNYERVDINNASGDYVITVTHKGNLTGGSQKFSLITTGERNDYAILSSQDKLEVCKNENAIFPINYISSSEFNGTVNLTMSGVPNGATAAFGNTSFNSNGSTTLSFTNLNAVPAGTYTIIVTATSGSQTKTKNLTLRVLDTEIGVTTLIFPANNATAVNTTTQLSWDENINAQEYEVQISTNPNFNRTSVNSRVVGNRFIVPSGALLPATTYYWKVIAKNSCGTQTTITTRSFKTFNCAEKNANLQSPIAIPDNNTAGITSTLIVNEPNSFPIGKLLVNVNIDHEYSGDLDITLESPTGVIVKLLQISSCATPNISLTFDDDAGELTCSPQAPGLRGNASPIDDLSVLNGAQVNGTWKLIVKDLGPADLGSLISWSLNFCEVPVTLSSNEETKLGFNVYPNPSSGSFNLLLPELNGESANISVMDLNGRVLYNKSYDSTFGNGEVQIELVDVTSGIYLVQMTQGNRREVKKLVISK